MKAIDILALACVAAALLACAAVPVDTAGDRARLLALHEQAMEAHRKGDVELLLQGDAEDFVLASRGEICDPRGTCAAGWLERPLDGT